MKVPKKIQGENRRRHKDISKDVLEGKEGEATKRWRREEKPENWPESQELKLKSDK
jgi:hypothetical protein